MNRRLFHKRFPAHVISLERTPERLARFRAWNEGADIDFNVFKAVDGATIDLGAVDPAILVSGTGSYRPSTIGVAMSHRALWQACAARDTPFLIFEDDAAVRHDIRSVLPELVDRLPDDWEMLVLGYNTNSIVEVAMADDLNMQIAFTVPYPNMAQLEKFARGTWPVGLMPLNTYFGNCSYLVSPRGARSLLKFCFPLDARVVTVPALKRSGHARTLDFRINAHLRFMRAFACVPPLAMPDNVPSRSVRMEANRPAG